MKYLPMLSISLGIACTGVSQAAQYLYTFGDGVNPPVDGGNYGGWNKKSNGTSSRAYNLDQGKYSATFDHNKPAGMGISSVNTFSLASTSSFSVTWDIDQFSKLDGTSLASTDLGNGVLLGMSNVTDNYVNQSADQGFFVKLTNDKFSFSLNNDTTSNKQFTVGNYATTDWLNLDKVTLTYDNNNDYSLVLTKKDMNTVSVSGNTASEGSTYGYSDLAGLNLYMKQSVHTKDRDDNTTTDVLIDYASIDLTTVAAVPEPSSVALLGLGGLALALRRRR
jgi:hypothetical protein